VTAGVTTYDLVDTGTGNSLLTGGVAPAPVASQRSYISGQPIQLSAQGAEPAFDLGGTVRVSGTVADGDRFTLAPSSSQSVFASIAQLVGALESNDTTAAGNAKFLNDVGAARNNATLALNNMVTARARVGSRLNELESLQAMGEQFGLQYDQALSDLQDLDYAAAATELAKRQISLEAAQQSFVRISQLSLFSLL
jgi:flagellar hook-associated protein 3 FlgL